MSYSSFNKALTALFQKISWWRAMVALFNCVS